jgi:hypothetical protein
MKLGTLKDGTRDGMLVVVSKDLKRASRPITSRHAAGRPG